MSIDNLKRVINRNLDIAKESERCIQSLLKRRTVEVISDFNDQQYGRSKKSLKGKRFKVHHSFVECGQVTVWLEGCRCGALLWVDVVLVDDATVEA